MNTLTLQMRFSSNVRIGTGAAASGLDEGIDHMAPLSSGAVKGILRDEARWLLPGSGKSDHPFVAAVFGDVRGRNCPWNFEVNPIGEIGEDRYSTRASLRLDANGAVTPGALKVKEEVSIHGATVEIVPRAPLSHRGLPGDLMDQELACHFGLLHVAARAAEKIGQQRTRGMGWVSFDCARSLDKDLGLIWRIREEGGAR